MRALLFLSLCVVGLSGCGSSSDPIEDFNARPVTLPDGTIVKTEVMMNKTDMAKGMMFRDSLPEGKGMLFIHPTENKYSYWMYQVNIPLDIVWMNRQRRVVEIVENAPPCKTKASECVNHGGTEMAMYVLELPGGYARKHAIAKGETLQF
jgi:uncharacterized protein